MAVVAGALKEKTGVIRPKQSENLRIGSSSNCTGIQLNAHNDEIILDSAADSNFPYPGADHHHIIYLKSVGASCEIYVSAENSGSSYVLLSTVTAAGVVQTGAITDLPFRYVKVKAITSAVTLDVQSFPALVR